jgi:FolB domain-containing protein
MKKSVFKIKIKNIEIPMYLGIYDWEKTHLRTISVSLILHTSSSDKNTKICYDEICQYLIKYHYKKFGLIEDLLNTIATDLLTEFPSINKTKVEVKKGLTLRGLPNKISIEQTIQK